MNPVWHTKTAAEIFSLLNTGEHGLSAGEVKHRLDSSTNKLPEDRPENTLIVFLRQFQSPLIYILLLAAGVVYLLDELANTYIILFVLFFNAVVGTIQEGKAQKTLLALKQYTATTATVIREGETVVIPDEEVVPGDILLLIEGVQVPADSRIISANNLKVTESALTGESEPVEKSTDTLVDEATLVADQRNMVFKGTHVVSGTGRAVVTATGLDTVIGKISSAVNRIDTEIPLKREIRRLSNYIVGLVVLVSILLFFFGVGIGKEPKEMFTLVVALAVSIIPEGLPIVMTLILAMGVKRMSKKNALVKRLQAVEALGQAEVIAVDKTGTITKNELVVERVYVDNKIFNIEGSGYEPKGGVRLDDNYIDPVNHPELIFAGKIATYCANARLAFAPETKAWLVSGDPTEAAMTVLGEKIGFHKADLEEESPMIAELPFDYRTKYHATLHQETGKKFLTVIGAPEPILDLSTRLWHPHHSEEMTADKRAELDEVISRLSAEGYRVLAFSFDHGDHLGLLEHENVRQLTFGGFFAMRDALRPEVHEAMERAEAAGIKVVMITGDHRVTAQAIARDAGIFHDGDLVVTGEELTSMSEAELDVKLSRVSVFARVTPDHKLRIIQAYKRQGKIIAMTGDGVNDAPSLVAADLGVAMGKIGTEVAKEAADIVLLDDNFGSIISAIEEGRNIYRTIKKALLYLFSTSMGELLTIVVALFIGYPLPVLAVQIIWLNLVTDGFLTVAWAMEPKEKNLLKDRQNKTHQLFDALMLNRMVLMALPMMLGTLYLFRDYLGGDMVRAWTISLTTLAVFQWFNAWNCRSERDSVFSRETLANGYLIGATAIVVALQLAAVYLAPFQKILNTTALTAWEWAIIIPVAASVVLVEEVRKYFQRRPSFIN